MAGRPFDYVALQTIYYGGSRAYNVGDPVPADNVERHGYQVGVQVAEYGTPDADRVTGRATPTTTGGPGPAAAGTDVDEPAPAKPTPKPAPKTMTKKS